MIKGVIFDMDGVLVDSEPYICEAGVRMFLEKGLKVQPNDFKEFTGMGEDRYLGGVAEKYGFTFNPSTDKARTYQIYKELVTGNIQPLPGVISFIGKCKNRKLKLAVASSADNIKVRINLKEIGLLHDTFDAIVDGEEVTKKKPHPDVFLKALEKLHIRPDECLVVEDAISGIRAAIDAGCKCLALTTSFPPEKLKEANWISKDLSYANDECITW